MIQLHLFLRFLCCSLRQLGQGRLLTVGSLLFKRDKFVGGYFGCFTAVHLSEKYTEEPPMMTLEKRSHWEQSEACRRTFPISHGYSVGPEIGKVRPHASL